MRNGNARTSGYSRLRRRGCTSLCGRRNHLKEKILEAVDIVDVIGERVSLSRKGKDYVGLCPFHDDHKPSMSVSQSKQIFKCWACGAGGDVIRFVQMSHRVEFKEALQLLAQRAGIEWSAGGGDGRGSADRERLRAAMQWACEHFRRNLHAPIGRTALEYARSRGFSDEAIERFRLGFAPPAWDDLLRAAGRAGIGRETLTEAGLIAAHEDRIYDRFRNRLIFPIHDPMGRTIAFGGRTLGDDPAKYLNSPETPLFNKSRTLFGLDLARDAISAAGEAIVVEGYVDALLLSAFGIQNVVAPLGTALTDSQVKLLKPLAQRVIMCFDGDEAGERAADRAVETALVHRLDVRVAVLPEDEDPADIVIGRGSDEMRGLLQSAVGALEFKWTRVARRVASNDPANKREAIEAFLQFVGRVTVNGGIGPLDLGLIVQRLADVLSIRPGDVYEFLSKARSGVRKPDSDISSADRPTEYSNQTRDLAPGLVAAVEELFGVALHEPQRFPQVEGALAASASRVPIWQRLSRTLQQIWDESGELATPAVLAALSDNGLFEAYSRARERVSAMNALNDEHVQAALTRVSEEMESLRFAALRGEMGRASAPEHVFRRMLDVGKRQNGVLGLDQARRMNN